MTHNSGSKAAETILHMGIRSNRTLAEERQRQAEERQRQAEEHQQQAEQERDQEREQTRQTTFAELIRYCHNCTSLCLRVESPSRSTTGTVPAPKGKRCPLQLLPWTECTAIQQEIYHSVCTYLAPPGQPAAQVYPSRTVLKGFGEEFKKRAIISEQDLQSYERFGVENHVRDIIAELCRIRAAREEFQLGNGIQFDNHANALDAVDADQSKTDKSANSRPDQYCIHRVDGDKNTTIMTVEYKPPHKLSVENLRAGLRQMQFWDEVVRPDSVPTEGPEKLRYNAAWLSGSAVVQEYHVMLQEGLEYSYLTNGFALVLLRVPYDNPGTLYYHLCEPNMEVNPDDELGSLQQPLTAVARVLCLCLMSFRSQYRDQEWRNATKKLPKWKTSFDHTRFQIPESELQQNPPDSEYTASEYTSSEPTTSEYIPSSSPAPPPADTRRIPTRSRASCAWPNLTPHQAPGGRKRGLSQIASSPSSPSAQRSAHLAGDQYTPIGSQACNEVVSWMLIAQMSCSTDRGGDSSQHPINAKTLIEQLKQQLDENIDRDCTPMGGCGASGVPFKVTCTAYGYTMVGKGTTPRRWEEVKREEVVYRVLDQAQASAVPVFLGAIDLAKSYFVHGAGEICHMLIMAWGGEPIHKIERDTTITREIARSEKEICSLGVSHQDLRSDNILWNAELGRALIIDFHCSKLNHRPMKRRVKSAGKHSYRELHKRKRLCIV
ncbi:uncharacterized protein BO88DRAFT_466581 [Aspergillus vadensis CBS 113365]|uniref:Protein kinase domain-containing protein n=1 Tax=Aspergillus vadensis (strain CBS 113365 / IMI 142717 / IBT 24658) TaxID=1448311 RepID=A0A319BVK3_ASPVC|nr:hypothetical protein BO88DRAFT_466581 [Aspergillus vadensis CBS 113365]PYH67158.1 hypothetical protein BO88DRAFT_466581 [Aspergillus vadensis CBS 113365]